MPVKGQKHRLAEGGLIDRSEPVGFTFDGRQFQGYRGDTLASALIANGVRLVGRSFKYHRPRGIYTAGSFEPNALVELRTGARREPNTQATTAELYDGLTAHSQNRWPSLSHDLMAVNSRLSPFLAAGFLLQDLHVAAPVLDQVLRAVHSARGGAGPCRRGQRPGPLRARLRPLRCAGGRRRAGRIGRGGSCSRGRRPGDPLRRRAEARRVSAVGARRDRRRGRTGMGARRRGQAYRRRRQAHDPDGGGRLV